MIPKIIVVTAIVLSGGCASQKPKAVIPYTHAGPEHMECTGLGPQADCQQVQSTITEDNRQILTPLGCALKKANVLQVFWIGMKDKPVCVSEIKK